MPPMGVKACLLIREDIEELINSKEFKDITSVNVADLGEGFTVPQYIVDKMFTVMTNIRKRIDNQRAVLDVDCTLKGSISELSAFDSDLSSPLE